MLPMYLWLAIFTLQPHKEERFLFVVYPLICLNAAIMLHLGRAWLAQLLTSLTKPVRRVYASRLQPDETMHWPKYCFSPWHRQKPNAYHLC